MSDDTKRTAQGDLFAGAADASVSGMQADARVSDRRRDQRARAALCRLCLAPLVFEAPHQVWDAENTEWRCSKCGNGGVISRRKAR